MTNYSKIYWLTRLDQIQNLVTIVTIIFFVVAIMYPIVRYAVMDIEMSDSALEKWDKRAKWKLRWFGFISILIMLIGIFTPSKNEMILIMAGGKTMDFVEKDTSLSKIPYQTAAIISSYLENSIQEMKKEKN